MGFLAACDTSTQLPSTTTNAQAATPPSSSRPWQNTYLYTEALYEDPVFKNDVDSFSKTIAQHMARPSAAYKFGTKGLPRSTGNAGFAALTDLAQKAQDGDDLVIAMFTSHGQKDMLAYKEPGKQYRAITAQMLKSRLAPLQNDKQVIIIQACFSGSLIDDLASPNRIILTAAAQDRSSFGCRPDRHNTWFIQALNASIAQGGSWQEIAKRTQSIIRGWEIKRGFPTRLYSNPQIYVGRNMQDIWRG
ncbi:MAG: C13 family peptidase [Maritimibacter sp.]